MLCSLQPCTETFPSWSFAGCVCKELCQMNVVLGSKAPDLGLETWKDPGRQEQPNAWPSGDVHGVGGGTRSAGVGRGCRDGLEQLQEAVIGDTVGRDREKRVLGRKTALGWGRSWQLLVTCVKSTVGCSEGSCVKQKSELQCCSVTLLCASIPSTKLPRSPQHKGRKRFQHSVMFVTRLRAEDVGETKVCPHQSSKGEEKRSCAEAVLRSTFPRLGGLNGIGAEM